MEKAFVPNFVHKARVVAATVDGIGRLLQRCPWMFGQNLGLEAMFKETCRILGVNFRLPSNRLPEDDDKFYEDPEFISMVQAIESSAKLKKSLPGKMRRGLPSFSLGISDDENNPESDVEIQDIPRRSVPFGNVDPGFYGVPTPFKAIVSPLQVGCDTTFPFFDVERLNDCSPVIFEEVFHDMIHQVLVPVA